MGNCLWLYRYCDEFKPPDGDDNGTPKPPERNLQDIEEEVNAVFTSNVLKEKEGQIILI